MNPEQSEHAMNTEEPIVWVPPAELLSQSAMSHLMHSISQRYGVTLRCYEDFHAWSIAYPEQFWGDALSFLGLIGEGTPAPLFSGAPGPTPLARSWFPSYRLNFAENLLAGDGHQASIISWSENRIKRRFSLGQLRLDVSAISHHLRSLGISANQRTFAYTPNIPEAIACMLATASLGALWSSCGTDYQIEGLRSRIERVQPVVLFATLSYQWRGKAQSLFQTIDQLVSETSSIKHVVFIDYLEQSTSAPVLSRSGVTTSLYRTITSLNTNPPSQFERFAFSHPLYIMFSSGTTGKPKGIVHSAGGTLLEHVKELKLHCDIRAGDRVLYQTSTSWMMWNWLVSALACQATVVLYDGDPMLDDGMILWKLVGEEGVTHFGTSAAYLGEIQRRSIKPPSSVSLSALRAIFSTGSALYPDTYDYVTEAIKPLWLQSISGGTDIIGCFGLGCPLKPVIRGEVQCKSLGYDVKVFDSNGVAVRGEQGELICASPAPSMPIHFLDDADGSAYRAAYFDDFPGVWRHGDYVKETHSGGLIFAGRSDATLKPSGVRVATADIYAALKRVNSIEGALAVGYTPPGQTNERIILFVTLPDGLSLTEEIQQTIRVELKRSNSFYVPALIIQAPELPRTTNNKLAELSVKRVLSGQDPGNTSALANPESLKFFTNTAVTIVTARLS